MKIKDCCSFVGMKYWFYSVERRAFEHPTMRYVLYYLPGSGFDIFEDFAGGSSYIQGWYCIYECCFSNSGFLNNYDTFYDYYYDNYDAVRRNWKYHYCDFLFGCGETEYEDV